MSLEPLKLIVSSNLTQCDACILKFLMDQASFYSHVSLMYGILIRPLYLYSIPQIEIEFNCARASTRPVSYNKQSLASIKSPSQKKRKRKKGQNLYHPQGWC